MVAQVAGRKRIFSDSSSSSWESTSSSSSSRHWEGYYPALKETFPFLVPVEDWDNEGKVIGVLRSLCIKHTTDQRNRAGMWTTKPCSYICKDIIQCHSNTHTQSTITFVVGFIYWGEHERVPHQHALLRTACSLMATYRKFQMSAEFLDTMTHSRIQWSPPMKADAVLWSGS